VFGWLIETVIAMVVDWHASSTLVGLINWNSYGTGKRTLIVTAWVFFSSSCSASIWHA